MLYDKIYSRQGSSMTLPQIPQDDLMDVKEMSDRIENYIGKVLDGVQENLAFSALTSATINCLIHNSKSMGDIMFHRNLFVQLLDSVIEDIEVIEEEEPS